jgi:DNA-binding transcriptional regulator/RsmH inhibitor MraZ
MQPGRDPVWNIVAEGEAGSWLESVKASSGSRLLLPVQLRKRVGWSSPKESLPLLASIEEDEGVTIAPMSEKKKELDAVLRAIRASQGQERPELAFAAMAIYSLVSLKPDGRLRLSPTLANHLLPHEDAKVWVGAHSHTIRLWPEEAWARKLQATSRLLREALEAARNV